MKLIDGIIKKIKYRRSSEEVSDEYYQYCTNCYATLPLQKGYDPTLRYWICKGCGQLLVNPEVESDIAWICDDCGAFMNEQPGFSEDCGEWKCTECGHVNKIDVSELYNSEEEYQAEKRNPYRGLSDGDALELSMYQEEESIEERNNIFLVRHKETETRYIKKLLTTYNKSVYSYLMEHPIAHMPRIIDVFESSNCLIVIEEFIIGQTLEHILERGLLSEEKAIIITENICEALDELHECPNPIIHRDVKPSNVIISIDSEVYLLDMNVAKWYDPEETDDTKYMGTQFYAAPEQLGYSFTGSTIKTDTYAVGMMLNVMITGCYPKYKRAEGVIWPIIEKCIRFEAKDRYTTKELIAALEEFKRKQK